MPNIFFGRQQALEAALRFSIVAIYVHQNLRGPAIVGDPHRSHTHESYARIRQLSFHQRFDFLAQGLA
jgi:hypothetical protein